MQMEQLAYLMAFNSIYRFTAADASQLIDYYHGDAAEAWRNYREWPRLCIMNEYQSREILADHDRIDPDHLLQEYLDSGCSVTTWSDDDYPALLRQICDPPLLLFYRGRLPADDELCLALIGSRQATPYGREVAEIFSRELAAQGAVIVSGMARGIDSVAHRGALSVGGRTVAVLGSGIDVIYPRENEQLYCEIASNGAVVSEFPLGTPALGRNFPRRNRIISGLCRGVIVAEAGEKSGTMATVHYAGAQGRDLFAVPGNITSRNSRGVNRLLRDDGAIMALEAADVWREYSEQPMRPAVAASSAASSGSTAAAGSNAIERRILYLLREPKQMDELAADSSLGMEAGTLNSLLLVMELKGAVRRLPGNYYQAVAKFIQA